MCTCTGTKTIVLLNPFAFSALMMEKILLKSFGGNNKPVNTDDDETAAISAAS